MNTIRHYWYYVRSSFWFTPGLIVLAAIALAFGLIEMNGLLDQQMIERWPRLLGAGADGSRALLGAIAGSMITVAGVVFSITLVALSLASSQYTPRVLRTFRRDRLNQTVLGVFVGIFMYCLVVLRAIRSDDTKTFVPSLAVLVGLILGLLGIAFLILFIHHIAISIQASQILAAVFKDTVKTVDRLYPDKGAEENNDDIAKSHRPQQTWRAVPALQTGYIQQVDVSELVAFSRERRTAVRIERCVGDFLIQGTPVAFIAEVEVEERDSRRLGSAVKVGRERSAEQDIGFGIRQLVDVALKSLSPGINDTTTAVMCVDYLTAVLVRLAGRRLESRHRIEDGEARLLTQEPTFADLVGQSFNQIRQNASGNVTVLAHLLQSLETLATHVATPTRRRVLLEQAIAVAEIGRRSIHPRADIEYFGSCARRVVSLLDATDPP